MIENFDSKLTNTRYANDILFQSKNLNEFLFTTESLIKQLRAVDLCLNTDKIKILDVKKENNIVVHDVDQLPKDLASELLASVDLERRHLISINHT